MGGSEYDVSSRVLTLVSSDYPHIRSVDLQSLTRGLAFEVLALAEAKGWYSQVGLKLLEGADYEAWLQEYGGIAREEIILNEIGSPCGIDVPGFSNLGVSDGLVCKVSNNNGSAVYRPVAAVECTTKSFGLPDYVERKIEGDKELFYALGVRWQVPVHFIVPGDVSVPSDLRSRCGVDLSREVRRKSGNIVVKSRHSTANLTRFFKRAIRYDEWRDGY